jgi:hypothetical protein
MPEQRQGPLTTPLAKAGIVVAGYIAAFVIASMVLKAYVAATDTPDRVSSGGMWAFGDGMLFLGVLALAAVPATGAALYWLRASIRFWNWLSLAALVVAATSLAAVLIYQTARNAATSTMAPIAAFAVLRLLITPGCAGLFLLAGLLAPSRTPRMRLLAAAAIELTVFGGTFFMWVWSARHST